jgi:hypothetical protein
MDELGRWLTELDARNRDNVARTESYLTLYAWTRAHPPELPWLLMAHLVSRNAGYAMTDLRVALAEPRTPALYRELGRNLFQLLERANFLIFWDAWHHVLEHLQGRAHALTPPRTAAFMCAAWRRYEAQAHRQRRVAPALEAALVYDLVENEQTLIEQRVVHHPRFGGGRLAIGLAEVLGRERGLRFPETTARIHVGWFASLARRIATGQRIYDEVVSDDRLRGRMFAWCERHPHTGSRSDYAGRPGPTLREAWPVAEVEAEFEDIHAPG